MTTETDSRRYVVEAKDEYGWFDYAHFESLADARDVIDELSLSGLQPKIIDRREQIEVK